MTRLNWLLDAARRNRLSKDDLWDIWFVFMLAAFLWVSMFAWGGVEYGG